MNINSAGDWFYNGWGTIRRGWRRWFPPEPGWATIALAGSYPVLAQPRWPWQRPALSATALAQAIRRLSEDPAVIGVRFEAGPLEMGAAAAYTLRQAMVDLSAKKATVFYAPLLGMWSYYLASAAREVVMPPGAELDLPGFSLGQVFLGAGLKRIGIDFEKYAIGRYKSAFDELVEGEMSQGAREEYRAYLEGLAAEFSGQVAQSRGKDPGLVREWVDRGFAEAAEAQQLGALDRLASARDLETRQDHPARYYLRRSPPPVRTHLGLRVAVVPILGNLVYGASGQVPGMGLVTGSESLVPALRKCEKDSGLAAVVLYIDSGGGSALASELIDQAVESLARVKPVVAVMGGVAASGGYFVAAHANRILAAPTTLTGSIGVVSLRPVLGQFYANLGLNPETLSWGERADSRYPFRGLREEEKLELHRSISATYQRFVGRVAHGRGLSPERVDELGQGRVWSGSDALERGLIDQLGGIVDALALAREMSQAGPEAPWFLVRTARRSPGVRLPLLAERAWAILPPPW